MTAVDESIIGLAEAARLAAAPWIVRTARAALTLTLFLIGAALKIGWIR